MPFHIHDSDEVTLHNARINGHLVLLTAHKWRGGERWLDAALIAYGFQEVIVFWSSAAPTTVAIDFGEPDIATRAVDSLDDSVFEGYTLKASRANADLQRQPLPQSRQLPSVKTAHESNKPTQDAIISGETSRLSFKTLMPGEMSRQSVKSIAAGKIQGPSTTSASASSRIICKKDASLDLTPNIQALDLGRARTAMTPEERLLNAFPNGWERLVTSATGLFCGLNALRISIREQRPDLPVPEVAVLMRHIDTESRKAFIAESRDYTLADTKNFRVDEIAFALMNWGQSLGQRLALGVTIQGRLPYIVPSRYGGDEDVIWVYNDGFQDIDGAQDVGMGHYEGIKALGSEGTTLRATTQPTTSTRTAILSSVNKLSGEALRHLPSLVTHDIADSAHAPVTSMATRRRRSEQRARSADYQALPFDSAWDYQEREPERHREKFLADRKRLDRQLSPTTAALFVANTGESDFEGMLGRQYSRPGAPDVEEVIVAYVGRHNAQYPCSAPVRYIPAGTSVEETAREKGYRPLTKQPNHIDFAKGKDTRKCEFPIDMNRIDRPDEDTLRYFRLGALAFQRLNIGKPYRRGLPMILEWNWTPTLDLARQCVALYRPGSPSEPLYLTDYLAAQRPWNPFNRGFLIALSRSATCGLGWGDFDRFHEWLCHGRAVRVEMLRDVNYRSSCDEPITFSPTAPDKFNMNPFIVNIALAAKDVPDDEASPGPGKTLYQLLTVKDKRKRDRQGGVYSGGRGRPGGSRGGGVPSGQGDTSGRSHGW